MCDTTRIVLMLLTSVLLAQYQGAISTESTTASADSAFLSDDDVDESLEGLNFTEFKERYRRLIQYRTYYVASNYLNSQLQGVPHQQQQHGYDRETLPQPSPPIRKPQRLVPLNRPIDPRRKPNGHRQSNSEGPTLHKHGEKFVPSVQYDPKNVGGDSDYFTPVKYDTKLHYDNSMEYSATGTVNKYENSRQRPRIYPEVANPAPPSYHQDVLYYGKDRPPSRPSGSLYTRKYLPNKPKAPLTNQHQDYLLDYGTRTSSKAQFSNSDYNYPADDYEPVRYVKIEPPPRSQPKPTRILAQSVPRQPLLPFYPPRNPAIDLHDIMKSLQLTNRLPEMLNRDNIDSSIKTLVEILSILNNAKQTDFPQLPVNQPAKTPTRNFPNYNEFKNGYTRPKVVTETRFQATPSPPVAHEDDLRYEHENSYEPNVNYEAVNAPKQQNVVEYYTPLVQDIEEPKTERFRPTPRPQKIEENTEHIYEITEDLAEDILEQNKFAPPITTETPVSKFKLPDGASHAQLVPPTTLKYGATRGKPNVDYPAYAAIPETDFNCKEQRYKGFFGDPSTGCQVWHYCDLNGGKSSFLCPNGTIFSQVALTCDWWFNVKCESTPQLYVLNERLYKYILPIMPKFPEDFSGPEVDRYLELKFKEMEAKLKEKKLKKQQEKDNVKEKLQALETEE